MIKEIILTRQDVVSIMTMIEAFTKGDVYVRVRSDSSSGIGAVVTATIDNIEIHGLIGSFTKTLVDEGSW